MQIPNLPGSQRPYEQNRMVLKKKNENLSPSVVVGIKQVNTNKELLSEPQRRLGAMSSA